MIYLHFIYMNKKIYLLAFPILRMNIIPFIIFNLKNQ